MRSRPRIRSAAALVAALLLALVTGCTPDPPAQRSAPTPTPDPARLQALLDRVEDAVRTGRPEAYRPLLSDRDPAFARTAEMIFDNLGRLQPAEVEFTGTGRVHQLDAQRREEIGDGGYAAEVRVAWAVRTDSAPATQRVWLTVVPEAERLLWAGVSDGPVRARPTPLWWLEAVRTANTPRVRVIAGRWADARGWAEAADRAARSVRTELGAVGTGWNGRLTIIVPSNTDLLEQMLGTDPGSNGGLAAISWVDGTPAASAPIRIMINSPELSGSARQIVLAHEAVHVATRSPSSPAPTWLVEGFADLVAYSGRPRPERDAAAGPILQQVRTDTVAPGWPAEEDFTGSVAERRRAYAASWLGCRYLDDRFGRAAVIDFYTRVDRSDSGATGPAARRAFGVRERQLVAGYHRYLDRLAGQS